MNKITYFIFAFVLFPALLFALEDHGEDESVFDNNTDGTIYCLGDRENSPGVICVSSAEPGESCVGDASTDTYPDQNDVDVIKMPNGCAYSIVDAPEGDEDNTFYGTCGTGTWWYTACALCVRHLQTGVVHHGRMDLDYFCDIMGGKDLVSCNADGTTIQPPHVIYECPDQDPPNTPTPTPTPSNTPNPSTPPNFEPPN